MESNVGRLGFLNSKRQRNSSTNRYGNASTPTIDTILTRLKRDKESTAALIYRLKGRLEATLLGVGFITVAAAYDWNRIFERATSDSPEKTDCHEGTYKKKEALDRPCTINYEEPPINQGRNQERSKLTGLVLFLSRLVNDKVNSP